MTERCNKLGYHWSDTGANITILWVCNLPLMLGLSLEWGRDWQKSVQEFVRDGIGIKVDRDHVFLIFLMEH